jgi:hypothetical protein
MPTVFIHSAEKKKRKLKIASPRYQVVFNSPSFGCPSPWERGKPSEYGATRQWGEAKRLTALPKLRTED